MVTALSSKGVVGVKARVNRSDVGWDINIAYPLTGLYILRVVNK